VYYYTGNTVSSSKIVIENWLYFHIFGIVVLFSPLRLNHFHTAWKEWKHIVPCYYCKHLAEFALFAQRIKSCSSSTARVHDDIVVMHSCLWKGSSAESLEVLLSYMSRNCWHRHLWQSLACGMLPAWPSLKGTEHSLKILLSLKLTLHQSSC